METPHSASEKAVLAMLVMFGGGLVVMGVCALLGLHSTLCVAIGLGTMLVVRRSFR